MMKTILRLIGRADTAPVEETRPPRPVAPTPLEQSAAAARARKEHTMSVLTSEIVGVKHACRALVKQVRADLESIDRFGGADD